MRSFWKIPIDAIEGSEISLGTIYYRTASYVYVMASEDERPAIEAVGGIREDMKKTTPRNRFLRTKIQRGDDMILVRPNEVQASDTVLEKNLPAIVVAGDSLTDVIADLG